LAPWPKRPGKIVFLDFDGVLNSEASERAMGTRYKFSPRSVRALNEILVKSRAYVVITSSWRGNWTLRENALFLQQSGLTSVCVVGKTPALKNDTRGLEIRTWLEGVSFPIQSFAILDDREDMEPYRDRLVLIDPQSGLNADHVGCTLEILARPWTH
jgi:hypothetical protein